MTDQLARPLWRGRTNVDALTIACVEHAEIIGGHEFTVTQGSYQAGAGDPLSAGTHDKGGVVDVRWCGHPDCVRALRAAGMAAWHRTPAQGPWPDHVHAVVVGHPLLSADAEKQVTAYLARRNGLASNGPDDGPQLDPIPWPVWPWPEEEEEDMPLTDDEITKIANRTADVLLAREVTVTMPDGKKSKRSVQQVLRETWQRVSKG